MENKTTNTALLVMDMQAAMLGRLPNGATCVANTAKAIATARAWQMPVIYVVVGFRKGFPEISSYNKGMSASKAVYANVDMDDFMKIHPDLAPIDGDITVVKRRYSAFGGSDLEVLLRGLNIQKLVLAGVSTSGVILSTTTEAADKDYGLTILADCCADTDEEVHNVLTTKIFPKRGDVMNVEEWGRG